MFEIHFISINEQGSLRKMCMLLENRLLILIPLELFVVVWSLLFISSNYGTGTHTSLAFSYVALGSSDQVNAKKKNASETELKPLLVDSIISQVWIWLLLCVPFIDLFACFVSKSFLTLNYLALAVSDEDKSSKAVRTL